MNLDFKTYVDKKKQSRALRKLIFSINVQSGSFRRAANSLRLIKVEYAKLGLALVDPNNYEKQLDLIVPSIEAWAEGRVIENIF